VRAMRGAPQLESGQSAELEQRLADGTVGSLQEHALVSLHPGRAVKEAGMRASSSRSVRPPTEVDARRHPGQAVTPERAIGGVRPEYRHIGYPVAQPKAAHTIVELIDFPDDIIARHERRPAAYRLPVAVAPDQHIRVLQTRGGHADSHLARTAVGRGSIDNLKPVGTTEAPDRDNPVARFSQGQILLARHTGEEAAFPATHP
jgi:hypothetical protein